MQMYNPGTKAKSKRISMNQRLDVLIEEIEKQMKRESAWRIVFPTETEGISDSIYNTLRVSADMIFEIHPGLHIPPPP